MNKLQMKALQQAKAELEQAHHMVLVHGDKPEFQPITDRRSKGNEVMALISSAQAWIEAACERDA